MLPNENALFKRLYLIFCYNYGIYQKILLELPEDSKDIHKRNMVNRYQIRPYEDIISKLCCVSFPQAI